MKKSFDVIADKEVEILVIGTAPGEMSLEKKEYYSHSNNSFWKIICDYFDISIPKKYEDRLHLLKSKHIGLGDVYEEFERSGSLDSDISNYSFKSFDQDSMPNLKLVLANGADAYKIIIKNNHFNNVKIVKCYSTSSSANGYIKQRKKQWGDALDSVFK